MRKRKEKLEAISFAASSASLGSRDSIRCIGIKHKRHIILATIELDALENNDRFYVANLIKYRFKAVILDYKM